MISNETNETPFQHNYVPDSFMSERPTPEITPGTKLILSVSQFAAVLLFVIFHIGSLIGVYISINQRLTIIETEVRVLSTERLRASENLSRDMAVLRDDVREVRSDIKLLMIGQQRAAAAAADKE
jgi:hypothetical protein